MNAVVTSLMECIRFCIGANLPSEASTDTESAAPKLTMTPELTYLSDQVSNSFSDDADI